MSSLFHIFEKKEKEVIDVTSAFFDGKFSNPIDNINSIDSKLLNHINGLQKELSEAIRYINALFEENYEVEFTKPSSNELFSSLQRLINKVATHKKKCDFTRKEMDTKMVLIDKMCIVSETV